MTQILSLILGVLEPEAEQEELSQAQMKKEQYEQSQNEIEIHQFETYDESQEIEERLEDEYATSQDLDGTSEKGEQTEELDVDEDDMDQDHTIVIYLFFGLNFWLILSNFRKCKKLIQTI